MVAVLSSHAVSARLNYTYRHIMTGSALSSIAETQSYITRGGRTHLRWCEQLLKHKFPQCATANLETSCLLEIGVISRKLRLRCGCQFPLSLRFIKQYAMTRYRSEGIALHILKLDGRRRQEDSFKPRYPLDNTGGWVPGCGRCGEQSLPSPGNEPRSFSTQPVTTDYWRRYHYARFTITSITTLT
jgi:hypothetical protein